MKTLAHRGASGYAPENTLSAFELAVYQGADGFELDVHLTKDNKIVVCHDFEINRTTNGEGYIKNYTYDELQKFNAGSWFSEDFSHEKIPLLEDVMKLVVKNQLYLNIEIKAGSSYYKGIEEQLICFVKKYKYEENIILSSFDHESLVICKGIDKNIKTGMLYASSLYNPWDYIKSLGVDAIHPNYKIIKPKLIEAAHKRNLSVNTYTVNQPNDIQALKSIGTDIIITNYPDRGVDKISS